MLVIQNALEPGGIRNAIVDLLTEGAIDLRVASAYVTRSGCDILIGAITDAVGSAAFTAMPKTLVTSFDFGLTEPRALRYWRQLPNSTVIVSGSEELAQRSLLPRRAFHPKLYAFGTDDMTCSALVGSANLTGRGFSINAEAAWSQHAIARADLDATFNQVCFGTETLTDNLLALYEDLRLLQPPSPERDQEIEPVPPPQYVLDLPPFRYAVEAGEIAPEHQRSMWVHGQGLQGGSRNQLELPRGAHRFFRFNFNDYANRDRIPIGQVVTRSGSRVRNDRVVAWHGSNSMERFYLPTTTQGGFNYEDTAIMFRRLADLSFEIVVTPWDSDMSRAWREASAQRGLLYLVADRGGRLVGFL